MGETSERDIEVQRTMSEAKIAGVRDLLDATARDDGRFPLSDHLLLDLESGGGPGFVGLVASEGDRIVAYAQISRANNASVLEVVVDPGHRGSGTLERDLLAAAIDAVGAEGGGSINWWAFDADEHHDELALSLGLRPGRRLYQMRRPLPTGERVEVTTRSFRADRDEQAWLDVNNRAFADHPEQGGWTLDTLRQREREPWFDADGFRLHERDGRLAAFCWTKVHPGDGMGDSAVDLGEIYVIAVDPDFQGLGLGRQLTLAGLDSIAGRGIEVGMLYVDADNTAAVTLYERLGFTVHRTDRAYLGTRAAS